MWSVIPNTADYGEYKNGVHAPGSMYAIANFGLKLGMTMTSTLLGWGLVASGFDDRVPEVTPDDQAKAILFFASDDSKGCNGQVIVVDNGRTI